MALTPITITWDSVQPDGSRPSGGLMFTLALDSVPVTITDSVSGETVVPVTIAGQIYNGQLLSANTGNPPLTLIANDDVDTVPVGTVYIVTEQLAAGSIAPWSLTVPHDSPDGTLDISSVRPTP
jgi:hypothetical protein